MAGYLCLGFEIHGVMRQNGMVHGAISKSFNTLIYAELYIFLPEMLSDEIFA